jgi:threonine/homoserine/homoserine lactone efflux protein
VLFFLAGVAAFVRPATSQAWNIGIVNWGTFLGALCFAVAGVMQLFERPAGP